MLVKLWNPSALKALVFVGRFGGHDFQPLSCDLPDNIRQCANAVNRDANLVVVSQRGRVRRDDAGAGQQKTSVRKGIVAIQIVDQHLRIASEFVESSSSAERRFSAA